MPHSIDAITELNPSNSVVFLGSGFSMGAINISGKSPPNGSSLRQHFIRALSLPDNSNYSLQILTDEFAESDANRLYNELSKVFRIISLDSFQQTILNECWRRIYTTNYDDIVEQHRHKIGQAPNSFDVSEDVPAKIPDGAVVHLHGSIRVVTPDNMHSSLVLGEASYVNQYLIKSPWYDQFQRDIAFADALFIIGYSMSDYHIAALLMEDKSLAERTFFIQGKHQDEIFKRRTIKYGRTLFIGIDGFAQGIKNIPRALPISDVSQLKSFRSMDPIRDRKGVVQPTAGEVYDLLVYGNFDAGRLARSLPQETYAITRHERVSAAADLIEKENSCIIDGRLGNGKTLFMHLLAFELTMRGWKCFLYKPGQEKISRELDVLRKVNRLVIFFDQYAIAQDIIREVSQSLPGSKIVFEIRTGTYEVRYHELEKLLPKPFGRMSLNGLTREEREAFSRLFERVGLSRNDIMKSSKNELRDMLLELFNNSSIK